MPVHNFKPSIMYWNLTVVVESKTNEVVETKVKCIGVIGADGEEESEKSREKKGLPCGVKPSQKETDDHELTHLQFMSWRKQCVTRIRRKRGH